MKKLFVGLVLPILAAAAIIGSGFSVWAFTDAPNDPFKNGDANVVIQGAQGNENFTFTLINGLGFSVDQKTPQITSEQGQTKPGAHWTFGKDAQNKDLTKAKIEPAANVTNWVAPKSITTKITIPTAIANFIQLNGTAEDEVRGDGIFYEYIWTLPNDFATKAVAEWDINTVVTPSYKTGKEPSTYALYTAMRDQINGSTKKIQIEYTLGY